MDIVFLVYDSRSGSTFLSNLMMKTLEGVIVTPEIGFEHLIKNKNIDKITPEEILEKNHLRNTNITIEKIAHLKRKAENASHLILLILNEFVKKHFTNQPVNYVVVKYGRHIFLWREILELFGKDTKFIFIYRDPRAVVNSKLKTIRPYYPFETFAWGGSFLAALRWKQYLSEAEKMKISGVNIHEVCYENLIKQPEKELEKIATFLDVRFKPLEKENQIQIKYLIPEKEKKIHNNVMKGLPIKDRINSWQKELPKKDLLIIEALLSSVMKKRGYIPLFNLSLPYRVFVIIKSLPFTFIKILRHYFLHFIFSLKKLIDEN